MHAVRVPLLGMAVAVALLLVENVGAVAYREHAMASIESEIADARRAVLHQELEPLRQEVKALHQELASDADGQVRLREIVDDAEAILREVEELTRPYAVDPIRPQPCDSFE